ncbi:MAG: hypothetical protein V5A68_07180 [Candidatus Thermoplasmatota archaeon]
MNENILKTLIIATLITTSFLPMVSSNTDTQPSKPPKADFFWIPEHPDTGENITLNASTTYVFHECEIISYEWDLNEDGLCDDDCGMIMTCCHHTQDLYDITLKVTDNELRTDKTTKTIDFRNPPETPTVTGNSSAKVGEPYTCHIVTTDPDDDDVFYKIDWGAKTTEWLGPYKSGETITEEYTFNCQGNFTIEVKSKDTTEAESDWGTLKTTVPLTVDFSKTTNFEFFNLILKYINRFYISYETFIK